MSDKFTKIIAAFAILFLIGIVIAEVMPEREDVPQDDSAVSSVVTPTESEPATEQKGQVQQAENLYYYNALDATEKEIYTAMYNSILNRSETELTTKDSEVVKKIFECVTNDHPEIFYCSSYKIESMQLYGEVVRLKFMPNYHMTEETVQDCQKKIDTYVRNCIASAPKGSDEYSKIKFVYEYIIDRTEYVPNAQNNQNICSVFLNGESVCMGYAKATQYILTQMGIETTLAYGHVTGGESHSWNLVLADGEYYYVDTTWGDAGYIRPGAAMNATSGQGINYEYFMITTQQILKTHTIDNVVPLPACVATRNNYFIREGLYLRSYEEATLATIFDRMHSENRKSVAFQCADEETYREVLDRLVTQQGVFKFVKGDGSVSYSYNDQLYTLIFWIE